MIAVSDTSPLNYLAVIGESPLLPKLFERVLMPPQVKGELGHPGAPTAVRHLIDVPPNWLAVQHTRQNPIPALARLDNGERYAVQLAYEVNPDMLLVDDLTGRRAADRLGLFTVGTLGILVMGARRGLADFDKAVSRAT